MPLLPKRALITQNPYHCISLVSFFLHIWHVYLQAFLIPFLWWHTLVSPFINLTVLTTIPLSRTVIPYNIIPTNITDYPSFSLSSLSVLLSKPKTSTHTSLSELQYPQTYQSLPLTGSDLSFHLNVPRMVVPSPIQWFTSVPIVLSFAMYTTIQLIPWMASIAWKFLMKKKNIEKNSAILIHYLYVDNSW